MATFSEKFGFKGSPFEKYVAENEPDIETYAVTPPYFDETRKHTQSVTSYVLFGFRGSGKSATRLTNEKKIWSERDGKGKIPLVVNLTDFEPLIGQRAVASVTANAIISHVCYLSIESLLLWISDQDEGEQILELLDDNERAQFISIVKALYLTVPEAQRRLSLSRTMQVLQQTWVNKTLYWIERRWDPIATIAAKITSSAGKRHLELDDISKELYELIKNDPSLAVGLVALNNVAQCARSFGFSGVCVYVDKVDEHSKTQSSAEEAAKLVYPILGQVQLMEVQGFAWIFFLWDKIKDSFSEEKYQVRLDKYAFSEISWDTEFLKSMVTKRLLHFSAGQVAGGQELCNPELSFNDKISGLISLVQRYPRELIRLLDVIIREYDAKYFSSIDRGLLSDSDFEDGVDGYVRNVVWTIYNRRYLSEILRLGRTEFTNKDVQAAFRIGDQSARNRIRNWVMSGAVRLSGTTASEGEGGGKPANVYSVSDPRIVRMMAKRLYDADALVVEAPVGEGD